MKLFDIIIKCVWYCGSFCDCNLKKKLFCKKHGWFNIYICLVKTVVAIEVEQKVV